MKKLLFALCFTLLFSGATFAAGENDDEAFENAVQNFGYLSGLVHQCTPEGKKGSMQKEVMQAYNGIVANFGANDAFFYAAAFGAGSTATYDAKKCSEYTASFRKQMEQGKNKK